MKVSLADEEETMYITRFIQDRCYLVTSTTMLAHGKALSAQNGSPGKHSDSSDLPFEKGGSMATVRGRQ